MLACKELLKKEIPDFLALGHAFQRKELSMMEYKGKSGGFGVYAERGGEFFMIRLRLLSGVCTVNQLETIYKWAKKYHLEELHFTTRQTIQLHHLPIDDVCAIMEAAIDEGIYTRGGGGNFPRNVSLSPLSGVAIDEVFDPTPFAIMVNEHFLSKITTYHLPRKLKVSFSNNEKDTGNATFNDLGFLAVEKEGKPYFKLYLCGGLGNHPQVSLAYDELVDPKDVLYHVEAFTNFFMAEGDYTNKAKARSRYIAMRLGPEETLRIYKEHYKKVKETEHFKELDASLSDGTVGASTTSYANLGIIPQRQKDLYSVVIHPAGGILAIDDAKQLVDFLKQIPNVELRLAMDESMYVRNLTKENANALLELTKSYNPQTNIHHAMSCIGVPTCQIGIAQTQKVLQEMLQYLDSKNINVDRLPSVHFSGCNNSCGTHQIAPLGFAGKRQKVEGELMDAFTVFAGGISGEGKTTLGTSYGTILAREVPEFMYQLALRLHDANISWEDYLTTQNDAFKQLVAQFASN